VSGDTRDDEFDMDLDSGQVSSLATFGSRPSARLAVFLQVRPVGSNASIVVIGGRTSVPTYPTVDDGVFVLDLGYSFPEQNLPIKTTTRGSSTTGGSSGSTTGAWSGSTGLPTTGRTITGSTGNVGTTTGGFSQSTSAPVATLSSTRSTESSTTVVIIVLGISVLVLVLLFCVLAGFVVRNRSNKRGPTKSRSSSLSSDTSGETSSADDGGAVPSHYTGVEDVAGDSSSN
jgi:hypothetical protein